MGDANVRRPVVTRFEHGMDFGLLVHKSPFMADKRDPLVLSNYIFELLEVNPAVAGFLIQLHTEDVDAVVESVTAHAEEGAGTKTTLYVGQEEEEEEVEEEEEGSHTANLRRYTDLHCPKARRRRLKAGQLLVPGLLGDPNVVCGTNTKGEVCLSGGACTALSGPLGGHLALTAQEHEALSMLRMACSMHLSQRALLRMPRRCTQRDLRTVWQRIMPYFPQTTIVKSTTGRNRAAAHVPLQSIVQNAISMARVIGKPPPSGVAIVVISVDATSLWKASSTRADVWVNVWGGGQNMLRR